MRILAGIVTYNPDIFRLRQNIDAVIQQVDKLLIIDNGSKNNFLSEIVKEYPNLSVIKLDENMGIAFALNQIGNYAVAEKYEWFLTLDQDTVIEKDLCGQYSSFINSHYEFITKIAILTCQFRDRNNPHFDNQKEEYLEVRDCITSAALNNTDIFINVKGFSNEMFIDEVDNDYCAKVRVAGKKIIRLKISGFLHEVGKATIHNILGFQMISENHSAFRKYYMSRNAIYMARKYLFFEKNYLYYYKYTIIILLKILFLEQDKMDKLFAYFRGIKDGFLMKIEDS